MTRSAIFPSSPDPRAAGPFDAVGTLGGPVSDVVGVTPDYLQRAEEARELVRSRARHTRGGWRDAAAEE